MRGVVKTTSPSMDIQISSNFERLLFDASGRSDEEVRNAMASLKQAQRFELAEKTLGTIRSGFDAGTAHVSETAAMIRHVQEKSGYLLDPHTAIGVHVARQKARSTAPMVVLGTAHPAKFPAAVKEASGIDPALPAWLSDLMDRHENFTALPSDLKIVEDHISRHARATN
jgi:threonine synthase